MTVKEMMQNSKASVTVEYLHKEKWGQGCESSMNSMLMLEGNSGDTSQTQSPSSL